MITYVTDPNRARSLADHLTCCQVSFQVHRQLSTWVFTCDRLTAEQEHIAWVICGSPTLLYSNKVENQASTD